MRNLNVAVAALALCSTVAYAQSGKTWDKSYPVSAHPAISIQSGSGGIHTSSCGSCKAVSIHVDARDGDLKDWMIVESSNGNHVSFEIKARNDHMWGWHGQSPEVTVQTPAETDATIKSGSGGVDVQGVSGSLVVTSGSGGVHVQGGGGQLRAESGSGGVQADGAFSQFRMRSGSGNVSLSLRPGLQLSGASSISTGSGGVNLAIARDVRANVHATTGSGGIHSDIPLTSSGDWGPSHNVSGSLNGGGPQLELTTGSGGVRISGI